VSLRERDVVVAGLLEDPTVAASLLSNCLSTAQAGSAEMKQLFSLSVPSTVSSDEEGQCCAGRRSVGDINTSKALLKLFACVFILTLLHRTLTSVFRTLEAHNRHTYRRISEVTSDYQRFIKLPRARISVRIRSTVSPLIGISSSSVCSCPYRARRHARSELLL
jgi:hypothetical protein